MSAHHDDLVRSIRLYISKIGGVTVGVDTPGLLFDRNGKPRRVGVKGTLDIAATIKGRAVWVDAKTGKDRLKPEQVNFCNAQSKAGGIAFAAWSVDDVAARLAMEGLIDG